MCKVNTTELIAILDKFVRNEIDKFDQLTSNTTFKFVEIQLILPVDNEFYQQTGMPNDMEFHLHCNKNGNYVTYIYNDQTLTLKMIEDKDIKNWFLNAKIQD